MMRSLFYEKQLVNEDFSIHRFIKGGGEDESKNPSRIIEEAQSSISCEEQ